MRGKSFRLSMLSAAGALMLVVFAGVMCQKQKSAEGETSKAAVSTNMPAKDSMMMSGKTMKADSSMKMGDTSKMGAANMSMKAGAMPKATMAGYYTCPMHPKVHEAKPGKCPICGMDLVYKAAGKTATKAKGSAPVHKKR
jgi:rubrerythrin